MSGVVLITGSVRASSRSAFLARAVLEGLAEAVIVVGPRSFEPGAALWGEPDAAVDAFVAAVARARAIVLATPIYKGTYAGALKVLVDLLPRDGLAGKPVVAVATGSEDAHGDRVARALTDIVDFFGARLVGPPLVLQDAHVPRNDTGGLRLSPAAASAVAETRRALVRALEEAGGVATASTGHASALAERAPTASGDGVGSPS
jgi:FMN reductase